MDSSGFEESYSGSCSGNSRSAFPGSEQQWVTSYKISYGNSTTSLQVIQDESGSDLVSFFPPKLIEPAGMQTKKNLGVIVVL